MLTGPLVLLIMEGILAPLPHSSRTAPRTFKAWFQLSIAGFVSHNTAFWIGTAKATPFRERRRMPLRIPPLRSHGVYMLKLLSESVSAHYTEIYFKPLYPFQAYFPNNIRRTPELVFSVFIDFIKKIY